MYLTGYYNNTTYLAVQLGE